MGWISALAGACATAVLFIGRFSGRAIRAEAKLDAIAALEVHGGEFIDAAQLYRILGKPIPAPIDHAANIRAKALPEPRWLR